MNADKSCVVVLSDGICVYEAESEAEDAFRLKVLGCYTGATIFISRETVKDLAQALIAWLEK